MSALLGPEAQLENDILGLLLDFRRSQQNPAGVPMGEAAIGRAVLLDPEFGDVAGALDRLKAAALVDEHEGRKRERAYSITVAGIRRFLIDRLIEMHAPELV
ncbi:MAG: hypothetical protein ABIR60_08605 [Allosphingosinicella sp.]